MFSSIYKYLNNFISLTDTEKQIFESAFTFRQVLKKFKLTEEGKIAEQRFINAQQMLSSFILDTPEERYRQFETAHGDLLLRVPHHIIASLLGFTPSPSAA